MSWCSGAACCVLPFFIRQISILLCTAMMLILIYIYGAPKSIWLRFEYLSRSKQFSVSRRFVVLISYISYDMLTTCERIALLFDDCEKNLFLFLVSRLKTPHTRKKCALVSITGCEKCECEWFRSECGTRASVRSQRVSRKINVCAECERAAKKARWREAK